MATPILQSINALSKTVDTMFSFSVISATNVVRKSVLKIYNANDTTLQTPIVTSTDTDNAIQFKHKLLSTTSGLSSLTDGNRYLATIDIYYTTTGSSDGTSSPISFICLPQPTLTYKSPQQDTSISLTSYDFEAEYDMNYGSTSIAITNRVQKYRFELYNSSNMLIDASDYIYGTGTLDSQTGKYNLLYTFNNLENNATYYSKAYVITEQGLEANATSSNISVAYQDVQLIAPEVTNKSCEGYIEVKSNITNIQGFSNATVSGSKINLTNPDKYVVWGYNPNGEDTEYKISFPTNDWSMLIKAEDVNLSDSNPFNDTEKEYLLKLSSLDNKENIYLYMRSYQTNTMKAELYAYNTDNNITTCIQSDNDISTNAEFYILITCKDGWFDVKLTTSALEV